jgi:hypothetical protein
MSEKLHFQTNIPVKVALKYIDGKDVPSDYGDQILYTLTDGRVMYVPPIVKKQILDLGIARGEPFTVTKSEKKNGNRRTIEWLVGIDNNGTRAPKDVQLSSHRGPFPSGGANGGRTAVVERSGQRPAPPANPRGFLVTSPGQFLLEAFAAAADVAALTERYAAGRGMELQFSAADVREIGLSIYRAGTKQ